MLSRSLRPLTAPISNLARHAIQPSVFLGPASIRTLANATDATASVPEAATIPPTSDATASRQLPYYIGRNNLNNVAVYHKTKRGGNYKMTTLKYVEGDLLALKQDLRTALKLSESEISLNSVTKHIEIRGFQRDKVLNFVHTMGF
ncbi:mitochondrial large subunit ribosomal protein-domain-containing protein [Xylaria arbuscula]|nr:mitochondrial large subunit ribosomal protein-domain-containing protein [Xylaria arbuscula]